MPQICKNSFGRGVGCAFRGRRRAATIVAMALGVCVVSAAPAAIVSDGDTVIGGTYVGTYASGTLTVNGGSALQSNRSYIGYHQGSSGAATVTGLGSSWITDTSLYIGHGGSGTLNVQNGGSVRSNGVPFAGEGTFLGYQAGSSGAVSVTGPNSTFGGDAVYVGYDGSGTLNVASGGAVNATTMYASLADLQGNGTINALGAVLDGNLVFDTPLAATKIVPFGSGGQLRLTLNPLATFYPDLGVGYKGNGTLRISNGVAVTSKTSAMLGYRAGSSGVATITGAGSKWAVRDNLYVGHRGDGSMTLEAGGQFSSQWYAFVGYDAGSSGLLTVTGAGSKWSNEGQLSVGTYGSGTMRVEAGGQVVSGGFGNFGYVGEGSSGGSGHVTVTGSGSKWTHAGPIHLGHYGSGTMNVEAGGWVSSNSEGHLGHFADGLGVATVRGAGSKWTTTGDLYVGHHGDGVIAITAGGQVSNANAHLGFFSPGSTGNVRVSGPGSKWTNSGSVSVGVAGTSALTVADGAQATARALSINSTSTARVHVSGDGMIVLGNASNVGTLSNNGTLAFYADAFLPAGVYRPVTEHANRNMTWSGSGAYTPTGGSWDGAGKTLTVAAATALAAGAVDIVTSFERLLVTDASSGKRAGASFGAIDAGVQFSATRMATPGDDDMLAAWDFSSNLAGATEVLLSFDVGPGLGELVLYHEQGGEWIPFEPALLTYDVNGILSFTVDSLGAYAVAPVPEPAGALVVAAMAGVLATSRRRRAVTRPSCADR